MTDNNANHRKVPLPPSRPNVNTQRPNLVANKNNVPIVPTVTTLDILKQQRNDVNNKPKAPVPAINLSNLRADINQPITKKVTTIEEDSSSIVTEVKNKRVPLSVNTNAGVNTADTTQVEKTKIGASKGSMDPSQGRTINPNNFSATQPASAVKFFNQQAQLRADAQKRANLLVHVQMQRMHMAQKRLLNSNNAVPQKRPKIDSTPKNTKNPSSNPNPSPDSYRFADPVEDVEVTGVYDHAQKFNTNTPVSAIPVTTVPPHVLKANRNNLGSIMNQNNRLKQPARMVINNSVVPVGVNLTRTTNSNNSDKTNQMNNINSAIGNGMNNIIEVKDDDNEDDNEAEEENLENAISVKLPLVGPFVNGFLSGKWLKLFFCCISNF